MLVPPTSMPRMVAMHAQLEQVDTLRTARVILMPGEECVFNGLAISSSRMLRLLWALHHFEG